MESRPLVRRTVSMPAATAAVRRSSKHEDAPEWPAGRAPAPDRDRRRTQRKSYLSHYRGSPPVHRERIRTVIWLERPAQATVTVFRASKVQ